MANNYGRLTPALTIMVWSFIALWKPRGLGDKYPTPFPNYEQVVSYISQLLFSVYLFLNLVYI
jgi:hypothetical protein